jgi:hypothetical protein
VKLKTALYLLALLISSGLYADSHRSLSSEGATVDFANISDGDLLPTVFTVRFSMSGMGIAPAGVHIENTGHHHLLIDVATLPDFDQPLSANENIHHFDKGQTETELRLVDREHTLLLVLADYSHTPHEPPVMSDTITIIVSVDAPAQTEETQD